MVLRVYLRFYGSLNDFLPSERRQAGFVHTLKEPGSVKDTIEALGVPHPEVGLIVVNGESVSFAYLVQDGDHISVYPMFCNLDVTPISRVQPLPLSPFRLVLDVHLGKLATYLRLLGLDVLYRNDYDDEELAEISSRENRMLLTQDRALLKRGKVIYGYLVRNSDPLQQVAEVLQRFDLMEKIQPMSRCLRCNGQLKPVKKEDIFDRLPPLTRQYYDEFAQCQACQQIYWQGAHFKGIQEFIQTLQNQSNV